MMAGAAMLTGGMFGRVKCDVRIGVTAGVAVLPLVLRRVFRGEHLHRDDRPWLAVVRALLDASPVHRRNPKRCDSEGGWRWASFRS